MAVAKRCDCSKRTYAQTLRETKGDKQFLCLLKMFINRMLAWLYHEYG